MKPGSRLDARPWRGTAALAALAPAWERLAREAGLDPLCNSHAWSVSYARAFAEERDVFGWSFEAGGEPVGIVALRREPGRGALALRRALFVADGSFDSDYLEPPIRPGAEREVARGVLDAARAESGLEALVFGGLPAESRFLTALRAELEARGLPRREHPVPCLVARLPDSFEGYLAGLKSRMRSKVRSALRAAEGRGARLVWCERKEELGEWLEELFRLHELRWRAEGRSGSFTDPHRRAFYLAFAGAALERGELRFARLEEGGGVSALQLGVCAGERYYQVQEGFDPAREEDRVGVALRGLAVAELIRRGVRVYDFMAGDSRHKRDWAGVERMCVTVGFPLEKWRARVVYGVKGWVERWRAGKSVDAPVEREFDGDPAATRE